MTVFIVVIIIVLIVVTISSTEMSTGSAGSLRTGLIWCRLDIVVMVSR